ncbi:hypothetical protein [Comamonas sp.]|uniref:hypothetical protein n=1 Tax=Comamonas sp. TaxID=34028 RepID=UPI003A8F311F
MSSEQIQISGTLLHDALVRTVPMGEDRTPMPVLSLVIDSDGPNPTPICAEQVYPPAMRAEADRIALTMKKGTRVTVQAPIAHIRTTLALCKEITVHGRAKHPKATTAKEAAHA